MGPVSSKANSVAKAYPNAGGNPVYDARPAWNADLGGMPRTSIGSWDGKHACAEPQACYVIDDVHHTFVSERRGTQVTQQLPPPRTRKKDSMSESVPVSPSQLKSALGGQVGQQLPPRQAKK